MEFHITNNFIVKDKDIYSEVGVELGFNRLNLFNQEGLDEVAISNRLDGALGNVSSEDVVIIQYPLFNDFTFDSILMKKIHLLNAKIILLLHETDPKSIEFYKLPDFIIVKSYSDFCLLKNRGFTNIFFLNDESEFSIKRLYFELLEKYSDKENFNCEELIHIAFGLYDKTGNYSIWVGVTMQTILEHTNSNVCFHILHDGTLNEENKNKLLKVCENTDSTIKFHLIDINEFNEIAKQVQGYTIGSVFRILIPDILSDLPKVLYLDADLFVNLDVKELWETNLEIHCIGAVRDMNVLNKQISPLPVKNNEIKFDEYFNSGVILMNLDGIRKDGNMRDKIVNYLKSHLNSDLPDQDALNVVYRNKVKYLDSKYNYYVRTVRSDYELELKEKIYHYVGTQCVLSHLNEVDLHYYKTVMESPWGIKFGDKILKQSLYRTNDRINSYEKIINKIVNNNVIRIFIGIDGITHNTMQIIQKRDEDIHLADINGLKEKIDLLKSEKKEFVVFITARIPNCISELEKIGLVNEKDFFVMHRFMSDIKGGYN